MIQAISSYINDFEAIHLSDMKEFGRQYSKDCEQLQKLASSITV